MDFPDFSTYTADIFEGQPFFFFSFFLLQNVEPQGDKKGENRYYPHYEGWSWDLFFRRKSLTDLIEEFREDGRADEDDLVRDFFDGGETVIWKVSFANESLRKP